MAEYMFKLTARWGFKSECVSSISEKLDSDKSARAYAIRMIKAHEGEIPTDVDVVIRKKSLLARSTQNVGVVLSNDFKTGKRIFKYLDSKKIEKGNYETKPLNLDGSFKGY